MYNMIQKNRENGKKGFTLAELLVVVAIIAVLVAISIPIFTSQLEKSREATDVANMRAAKAAAVVQYLNSGEAFGTKAAPYYYDADAGKIISTKPANGYGKGTTKDANTKYSTYSSTTAYTDKVITVVVDTDGTVTLDWAVIS